MNEREERIARAIKRLERTLCTERLRKTVSQTMVILEAKEQYDVLALVVYEAWLVHRSRSLVCGEPCKSLDDFVNQFLGFSFLGGVEDE